MFAGYKDEVAEPTDADVGKFIPQKEIETWWKQQQKKFPTIYPPEEACPLQYPQGTKLMCFLDDDPEKPVRIEIVGSRWRKDQLMGKQAMYVVLQDGVYQQTEFSSAHEDDPDVGWSLGWDVPPPTGE